LGLPILGQDVVIFIISNMAAVVRAGQASVGICCYLHHHLYLYSGSGLDVFQIPQHRQALFVMCKHMWTHFKLLGLLILTTFFLACNSVDKNKGDKVKTTDTFKSGLVERQVAKSDFYISIPADYSIKETNGPDFSVYYFSPTDTTIKGNFAGGLYFGNFPSEFEKDNDSCKTTTLKSTILNTNADWTVYNCSNNYTLQTIIDSKSGEDWNEKIHAFGHAKSEDNLHKVLDIYSTLKQKKK